MISLSVSPPTRSLPRSQHGDSLTSKLRITIEYKYNYTYNNVPAVPVHSPLCPPPGPVSGNPPRLRLNSKQRGESFVKEKIYKYRAREMNFADTSECVCVLEGGASVTERVRELEINQTSTRLRETQPSYRHVGRK